MAGIGEDHPARIGDYVVHRRLTETATAELFVAQHAHGGALVCVKRIRPELSDDEDFVADFVSVAERAIQLRHPNVVRVYEWGQHDGCFLAMELIDGPDLATLLGEVETLAAPLAAHVGASLALALAHIHHRDGAREPLIHFDVTPHNVLIGGSGEVKLSDFGLAKALGTTGAATLTRERGKAGYLAPEQLDPTSLVTARVDLFALGLVLWQALIGTHPYVERCPPGRSLQRWIPAQLERNARRRVAEAAPMAPAGLCDAIERLLQ
ncbi:MAG TPA: serine/threonine-protein kinase, partial [Sandaracinaceae bacterium LLY-WYZ-13_1]|nr:serine/threonine-protein kinase [Sandaracinaceae bacterium LLY-WYZ-13_1]